MTNHDHGLDDLDQAIEKRAYQLWEEEGRLADREVYYWLEAEQKLLLGKRTSTPVIPAERSEPTTRTVSGRRSKMPAIGSTSSGSDNSTK